MIFGAVEPTIKDGIAMRGRQLIGWLLANLFLKNGFSGQGLAGDFWMLVRFSCCGYN
jgi:hypothetical protein